MELRTRILPHMLNSEVEEYLQHNDIIIVPVGTVELHGGFPLDVETTCSEGMAVKMAEACDALVLTGLPYFYAGATAMARGTTQVSVRQGIDYLGAVARSLLRQGFKRQIYISMHGPAHMTCSPMIRDFFDETGVPILYIDTALQLFNPKGSPLGSSMEEFIENMNGVFVAGYDIMGRLEDVPLTADYEHQDTQTVAQFNDLFNMAYQSGSIGYCFGDVKDHASTPAIPTEQRRRELADKGKAVIDKMVEHMNMPATVQKMAELKVFEEEVMERCPWMPAAWNKSHNK